MFHLQGRIVTIALGVDLRSGSRGSTINMFRIKPVCLLSMFAWNAVNGFQSPKLESIVTRNGLYSCNDSFQEHEPGRRRLIQSIASTCAAVAGLEFFPAATDAAVGSLPEFSDTNAIVQGITVNVADKSQEEAMINFLVNGFDFKVLRKRIVDSVEDTVGVAIVACWEMPVSMTNSIFLNQSNATLCLTQHSGWDSVPNS